MPAATGSRRPPRPPKVAVSRERLLEWLSRRAETPVRILCAPQGFGKSLLVQSYVARRERAAYIHASTLMAGDRALRGLATTLGITGVANTPGSNDESRGVDLRAEVAIDDIDMLPDDVLDALLDLVLKAPSEVTFILGTRSREAIDPRWIVDGTAETLDTMRLAFDEDEIADLAQRYVVRYTEPDIAELHRETDGWPMLVHAAIRHAHLSQRPLTHCFGVWFEECGAALHDLIKTSSGELFRTYGDGYAQDLQALERSGEFVCRKGGRYALLQPVLAAMQRTVVEAPQLPAIVPIETSILGEFAAYIDGERISWVRRKDAQLFKYLALRAGEAVTREELCRVFWPQHDRPQAHQNLRTSCCNIRSALRACISSTPVERYFVSAGADVCVPADAVTLDLATFLKHCETAERAMRERRYDVALAEYEIAVQLYRGPLMVEPKEAFYDAAARDASESFEIARRHVTTLRGLHATPVRSSQIA